MDKVSRSIFLIENLDVVTIWVYPSCIVTELMYRVWIDLC